MAIAGSTISQTLRRTLRRALLFAAVVVAIGVAAVAVIHLRITQERASLLLLHEVEGLSVAGAIEHDVLSVEKEVNRFYESWQETQPVEVGISVFIDNRLIANAGVTPNRTIFVTKTVHERALPNGTQLRVIVGTDSSGYWGHILLYLLAAEALLAGFFLLLAKALDDSTAKIVSPLNELITWLEVTAVNLPSSLQFKTLESNSGLAEVRTLNDSVHRLLSRISELQANVAAAHVERARVEVAEQVGHDLKSLVATVELQLGKMSQLDAGKRASISQALIRIRGVIQSLKEGSKYADSSARADQVEPLVLVYPLIERLVSEKEPLATSRGLSLRLAEVTAEARFSSTRADANELLRSVSNLIDNSIEASKPGGEILVGLTLDGSSCRVSVTDTGCGIPKDLLGKLATRGGSFGKDGGSGLGLFYARSCAEHWGGSLTISSELGQGTVVTLTTPTVIEPWLPKALEVPRGGRIVVLDDDTLIHQVWRRRFSAIADDVTLTCHLAPSELLSKERARSIDPATVYLVDYHLGPGVPSGLDVIERLGIANRTILVSGCFDDPEVEARATKLGVRRISKDWMEFLPIRVVDRETRANGLTIRRGTGKASQVSGQPAKAVTMEG